MHLSVSTIFLLTLGSFGAALPGHVPRPTTKSTTKVTSTITATSTTTVATPTLTETVIPAPSTPQCGGKNWTGSTTCSKTDYVCFEFNESYSECIHKSQVQKWTVGKPASP
ncbi:hypothetical protein DFP72DRAFT_905538 [Ephemerocybe angulata]|uniref:CBM1 domain-containing protein n=1 Tax=Ephemerocybe angulata TaxID=980116 RepID=A0A8H6HSB4_9AGAR|nr:hypothetical protein DFP72DRAFT_905538 [Tulosesus angulatus]